MSCTVIQSLAELVGKTKNKTLLDLGFVLGFTAKPLWACVFLWEQFLLENNYILNQGNLLLKITPISFNQISIYWKRLLFFFLKFFQDWRGYVSYYVAMAILKLLGSGDPPASALWVAGNSDVTADPVLFLAFVLWCWVVPISSWTSHIVIDAKFSLIASWSSCIVISLALLPSAFRSEVRL